MLRATGRTRTVRVPTFFGASMVVVLPEAVSATIWRFGVVEPEVCLFMLRTLAAGGRYVDVGAHYGFFALLAAGVVGPQGRVLAIEPTPATFQVLRANVAAASHVEPCPCAAFDQDREIAMYDYGPALSGFNSILGIRLSGRPVRGTERIVRAQRVDDLLEERGWDRAFEARGTDVVPHRPRERYGDGNLPGLPAQAGAARGTQPFAPSPGLYQ